MAAKRKISFKKKAVVKPEVIEEENTVTTDIENEIIDDEPEAWTVFKDEEEIFVKKQKITWTIGWTNVVKPQWRIRFEAQVAPYPMFKLPEHLRRYLQSHGLNTNVWRQDKERLEKHNVDIKIVEELKKFLTEWL